MINKNGNFFRRITNNIASTEQAEWAPDDRQFIFSEQVLDTKKISIMTIDGKYKRRLTKSAKNIHETNPSWNKNFDWSLLQNAEKNF